MYGATIWVLFYRRATPRVNVINVMVATSLFVLSTLVRRPSGQLYVLPFSR